MSEFKTVSGMLDTDRISYNKVIRYETVRTIASYSHH